MRLLHDLFIQDGSLFFIISLILKSVLIILLAIMAASLLRRKSAAVRHWIWSLMFGILILLIPLAALMPDKPMYILPAAQNNLQTINSPIPVGSENETIPLMEIDKISPIDRSSREISPVNLGLNKDRGIDKTSAIQQPRGRPLSAPAGENRNMSTIGGLILMSWLAGTLMLLVRLGWNLARIRQLAREGSTISDPRLQTIFKKWIAQCQIKQKIRLIENKKVPVPATFGLFHPIILLPEGFDGWSGKKKHTILCHELGHIKRMDFLPNVIAQIAGALYWFNPFIWMAIRRFWTDREKACDDFVLRKGFPETEYAKHLLDVSRGLPRWMPIKHCASVMAWKSDLKNRLNHILRQKTVRKQLSGRALVLSLLFGLFILLPLAVAKIQEKTIHEEPEGPLYTKTLPKLIEYLKSENPDDQVQAAWSLGDREDPAAVPALIDTLKDPDPDVRGMAAWALGEIRDRGALLPLIQNLHDENAYAREMMVKAVGEFEDKTVVTSLVGMLKDEFPAVRLAVVWALGEIKGSAARSAIISSLDDESPEVREMAVDLLGQFKTPETESPLITMLEDEESTVRIKAAISLGKLNCRKAIDQLIETLGDRHADVKCAAIWALGEIGDPRSLKPLLKMLKDHDSSVRHWTVWALDEISPNQGN